MSGQAQRSSVKKEYSDALGLAAWIFVELEWNAVNVGDRIEPGFINTVSTMTAGTIADSVLRIVKTLEESADKNRLLKSAKKFLQLVATRNDLMHASPVADPNNNGESALYRKYKVLPLEFLLDAADDFFDCSTAFNSELYGFLKMNADPELET